MPKITPEKDLKSTSARSSRLVPAPAEQAQPGPQMDSAQPIRPGSAKGQIVYMAEDFNAPLDEFLE
jgi:hypothetical protein